MNEEIASLQKNHTWQLIEKPKDKKKNWLLQMSLQKKGRDSKSKE